MILLVSDALTARTIIIIICGNRRSIITFPTSQIGVVCAYNTLICYGIVQCRVRDAGKIPIVRTLLALANPNPSNMYIISVIVFLRHPVGSLHPIIVAPSRSPMKVPTYNTSKVFDFSHDIMRPRNIKSKILKIYRFIRKIMNFNSIYY